MHLLYGSEQQCRICNGHGGEKLYVSLYLSFSWETFVEINSFRNVLANNKSGQTKEYQPTDTAVPFPTACIVTSPDLAGRVTGADKLDEQMLFCFA